MIFQYFYHNIFGCCIVTVYQLKWRPFFSICWKMSYKTFSCCTIISLKERCLESCLALSAEKLKLLSVYPSIWLSASEKLTEQSRSCKRSYKITFWYSIVVITDFCFNVGGKLESCISQAWKVLIRYILYLYVSTKLWGISC